MATKEQSKVISYLLRVLIVLLVLVMVFAVRYPTQQWKMQQENQRICREKMEDVASMSFQHYYFHHYFTEDLQEMIENLRGDTLKGVDPIGIFWERKQVNLGEPGIRDSLLIDFEDHFHGDNLRVTEIGQNLVQVTVEPKAMYQGLLSDTLKLFSDEPIHMQHRLGGLEETAWWASTPEQFDSLALVRGGKSNMPVQNYVFANPLDSIPVCPVYHEQFEIHNVLKYRYRGVMEFTQLDSLAEKSLTTDSTARYLFLSHFKNEHKSAYTDLAFEKKEALRQELGEETYELPQDSLMLIIRDVLTTELLKYDPANQAKKSRRGRKAKVNHYAGVLETEQTQIARADSMDYFTQVENVHDLVFPLLIAPSEAKVFDQLLEDPQISNLLSAFTWQDSIEVTRIDTVGQAIYLPIDPEQFEHRSFIDRLFGVDAPEGHGFIYNQVKSWEE